MRGLDGEAEKAAECGCTFTSKPSRRSRCYPYHGMCSCGLPKHVREAGLERLRKARLTPRQLSRTHGLRKS